MHTDASSFRTGRLKNAKGVSIGNPNASNFRVGLVLRSLLCFGGISKSARVWNHNIKFVRTVVC